MYYEARGLSADTLKSLKAMGYKMVEQTPWGAAEVILYGLPGAAGVASSSGNDGAVSGKVRPGFIYGANDPAPAGWGCARLLTGGAGMRLFFALWPSPETG